DHGPLAVPAEDAAGAGHAERVQLRGAQRAHARSADHRNAGVERIEDLLVPDAGLRFEHAVDERDRPRPEPDHAPDVALARRREQVEPPGFARRQRGAEKGDDHKSSDRRRSGANTFTTWRGSRSSSTMATRTPRSARRRSR